MSDSSPILRVALAGNPNAGKSSVFNLLTGLQQKVGNFPGVTVDKKTGHFRLKDGRRVQLVDLPGVYSLYPHSPDQIVTLQVLLNRRDALHPDLVLYIADASNLERHMLLFSQIVDLGIPVLLCVNQLDLAAKEGMSVDCPKLSRDLGIPVFGINGRSGEGMEDVLEAMSQAVAPRPEPMWKADQSLVEVVRRAGQSLESHSNYTAYLHAHHHRILPWVEPDLSFRLERDLNNFGFQPLKAQVNETLSRFDLIGRLLQNALSKGDQAPRDFSDRIDRVLTHPIFGSVIFFGVLLMIFQAVFRWAGVPMELMDQGLTWSRQFLSVRLGDHLLSDLLINGLLPGIGGILIFIPQIAILFILVSLMEEVGYMARAVYLADNMMRRFGLNGRSFVALISGVACAVPAVMTARGITNRQERLATIFVTPFMTCSARLPVFALLIAFAVPAGSLAGGWLNTQGLLMFGLYMLGAGAALVTAWLIKQFFKSTEPSYLMLELPSYRAPHWRNVYMTVWQKVSIFVVDAGKIILVISMILWALSSYGPGGMVKNAEAYIASEFPDVDPSSAEYSQLVSARRLEVSWAGHMGKLIEPGIAPLGFDWKIGIALISSFAAREVFVGTMATIYGAGDGENKTGIVESMRRDVNPSTGNPVYGTATAVSLLLFYLFAMQCMSTLAIVKRETNSWRIPIIQFFYMTGLAYGASFLAYQVLS